MNLFNKNNSENKKDLIDGVPKEGFKRYLFILSNHFFNLMTLNLLFLFTCLPIITIPASIFALTKVTMILYHTGTCSLYSDYWMEFKRDFFKRIIVVFLLIFSPISMSAWFFILGYSSIGIGVGIILLPVYYLTLTYFIPLAASNEETISKNIKESFLVVLNNWKRSLRLLFVPILLYTLSFYFLPYTAIIGIFILFSAGQLFVCYTLENIIKPPLF